MHTHLHQVASKQCLEEILWHQAIIKRGLKETSKYRPAVPVYNLLGEVSSSTLVFLYLILPFLTYHLGWGKLITSPAAFSTEIQAFLNPCAQKHKMSEKYQ